MFRIRPPVSVCLLPAAALVTTMAATPGTTRAQEATSAAPASEPVTVEVFRDPRLKARPDTAYPYSKASNRVEGWVVLSMMIDPQGKPYEIGVEDSTGDKAFEKAAVEAMERTPFAPGTVDGKPVESVFEIRLIFGLDEKPKADPGFVAAYENLQNAVKDNNRAAADAAMQKLKVTTLYEHTYYGLASYSYATRWGNEEQQQAGLIRALGEENRLGRKEANPLWLALLKLDLKLHDYYQVLQIAQRLQRAGVDTGTGALLKPIIEEVTRLRTAQGSYPMSGSIAEHGIWRVHLFRRKFQAAATGVISTVKLRCTKGFVSFPFDPELQYTVPEKLGECWLDLEGTPGTQLTLTQSS